MSHSFQQLLRQIETADTNGATETIVRRFTSQLVDLATRKMTPQLQQRVSAESVVESVFVMVYQKLGDLLKVREDGQRPTESWEQLWAFLATLARRRICYHAERNRALRRSVDREIPLVEEAQVLARDPGPDDVLVVEELYNEVMRRLRENRAPETGELYCRIARELFEGTKYEDIARELNTSLSTIGRVRTRVEDLLTELLADASTS